ncbi:MAG: putative manganese-dependent inorganic diphosphatase [Lachnospiraceae bacterium]|nr:putative manganese-dependent inorganic diphosphatase [Lachnospiraceae bacterium]
MNNRIYVIGHKNPDTDSICSAIALAFLKNQTEDKTFVAKRAGQINEETEFVLKYFGTQAPEYMPDAGTQVRDMEIRFLPGMSKEISVKTAWEYMQENNAITLAMTDSENNIEGIISMSDITGNMMRHNPKSLSEAKTPFMHIANTLEGKIIVGNKDGIFDKGKVFIGAANPDLVSKYLEPNDLVILGNRAEDHLNAVEKGASCIVVGLNAEVSHVIQNYAEEMGTVIITSPYDSFAIARLIEQSIPVRALMVKDNLITFHKEDFTEKIRPIMGKTRIRNFPVLDKRDKYVGTVSRRNFLNIQKKKVILVDHNEKSQAIDNIDQAEIIEVVDHHKIGAVETNKPIMFRNQPVGCTATIIRQMFQEKCVEVPKDIAGLLCAAILSDTLMFRSPTCTPLDKMVAEELAGIAQIDIEKFAEEMFRAGSNLMDKTPEEIFYQDFKKFIAGDVTFGVGQISSMAAVDLKTLKERLAPYLESECGKHGIRMVFFMLTNIMDESTELIFCGEGAAELIKEAFGIDAENEACVLKGIVSRKKQLIPPMMTVLQGEQ